MANTLRTPKQKEPELKRSSAGASMFSALDRMLRLDQFFEQGLPIEYAPKVLFVTALVIVYIANGHFADRNSRRINKLKDEVEDLRADYITMKSEYMYQSKQSEVAKKAAAMDIYESDSPPVKVVIKN